MQRLGLILFLLSALSCSTFAQMYDGRTQMETTLDQLIQKVQPGTIVFLGESHGLAVHRDQHVEILQALRSKGLKVSVGLEFINYTDQNYVDDYRLTKIDEPTFLNAIKWAGISFDFYKPQLNFPDISQGEFSLGLNIPKNITSKISKTGLSSLSIDEMALMPPQFAVGNDFYKARFMAAAGAHCKVPENCFVAQCAWDDTMAWQAVQFIQQHPDQVLVVVVGEFHVQYGGGTPARVKARFPTANIVTLSQLTTPDFSPSRHEGPRADFVWVHR